MALEMVLQLLSNSPVPLCELFGCILYKLIGFPETCISLMWTLLIPGLICAMLAQGENFTVLPRPPLAES